MNTFAFAMDFIVQTCVNKQCGIAFGVPKDWDRCRRNDHVAFYCPNGHRQWYNAESDEERLKRELAKAELNATFYKDQLESTRESKAAVERSLAATKGVVTRTKRRVGHGVCPCCTRHFGNLERHMGTKHPEYLKAEP